MSRKTALITGASRGIGKAVSKQLAEAGYDLILTCVHSEEELKSYSAWLEKEYSIHCQVFTGDLAEASNCELLFEQVTSLDVLVNNAGIAYYGLLQDMSPEELLYVCNVNLNAPMLCSKYAIPYFLQKGEGAIINISSVWGQVGASMEVAYSATKGGLNAFTKALAKELAPSGISVNAISCGMIDTDMNGHLSEEEKQDIVDDIPADRMGTPEEVAKMVLQIIESPRYLTGQVIGFDGGWI